MTELAVIVPTRSRPQNIRPIVDAWHATGAFDVATLVFGIDSDDARCGTYMNTLLSTPEVGYIVFPVWMPLVPKMNAMATSRVENHRIIAFMGDDHIPRTPRWAHMLVENHLTQSVLPWIWYGQDGLQDRKLPTWWSMDSRIVDKLGRMVPAPVQHLFCDNAVLELGSAARRISYDERILIEHMHPFAGKGDLDAQYERVNRHQQYARDGAAFHGWMADGLRRDATLLASIGG